MLTQPAVPLPCLEEQPSFIKIKRIEVFVIPAFEADSSGYRVCLRITSDMGYGWSELFINSSEKPLDWISWSGLLLRFIGTYSLTPFTNGYIDKASKDERIYRLFFNAVERVCMQPSYPNCQEYQTEESIHLKRAVSYVSLF
ncbi:hypothetical protein L1N85_14620 [Paenibacillus alkaliterrae]|uniref:hypothetical protein n=1 Tax=Paenibacillus alkaliterrae TaxID=320909 RepID=UPI001F173BE9|nr:hypothetical protein [Paenibacillus alkaliterrae]MCF2939654.1 hypothetical protein [Paenibacillus alkaliterrae]